MTMPARVKLAAIAVAVVVAGAAAYLAADKYYLDPASERRTEAADLRDINTRYENTLLSAADTGWNDITATMLAASDQTVSHRLRSLVSAIAESAGLTEIVVTHGRPSVPSNPAADRKSEVSKPLRDALSDREDFRVVRATLRASGTLEQIAIAAATLAAQPWAHRVETLRVEPANRERTAFDLTLAFATLYTTDRAETEPPALREPDPARVQPVLEIARRNPFVIPEAPVVPPPPVVEAPPPTPAPPPPPPFDQWKITGVAERRDGPSAGTPELFLRRNDTGETRVIRPGDTVLGLTLDAADAVNAVFREGDRRVQVPIGRTLADRIPID